jgi:hypothetical protein
MLYALSNLKSVILYSFLFVFCLPSRASGHGLDTLVIFGEGKCCNENGKYILTRASEKLSALLLRIVQLVTLLVGHDTIPVVYLSPTAVVQM